MKNLIIFASIFLGFYTTTHAQNNVCLGNDLDICAGESVTIDICAGGTPTANGNVEFLGLISETSLSDDSFTGSIPISFPFTYYGVVYNNLVISSNGYVSFDVSQANGYSPWSINGAVPGAGPMNAIMGPWQDYNPGAGGTVGYKVIGTAPNRKFVAVWKEVFMFGTQTKGCSVIVLHEGTNKIEVHLDEKPVVAWNGGAAIEATQNPNGTIAHVVPGRNYPTQWTANLDSWEWVVNGPGAYTMSQIPYVAYVIDNNSTTWGDTEGNTYTSNTNSITVTPSPTAPSDSIGYFVNYSTCASLANASTSDTTWITVHSVTPWVTTTPDVCSSGVGTATATPSGPGYTYLWNDPAAQTTETATGLFSGNYTVTVTDVFGCSGTAMGFVGDNPISTSTTYTQVSCPGGNDGTATAVITPTPGSATYNWYDAGGQVTETATGLAAGTYHVEVTTDAGCIDTAEVVIDEIPGMILTQTDLQNVSCNSAFNGVVTVEVTQGTGPYTYSWSNSNSTTATANDLPVGPTTVTVTDANGCTVMDTYNLTQPLGLSIDYLTPDYTICPGDSTKIRAGGSGGSSAYTYTWKANGNVIGTGDEIWVTPGTSVTNYCVTMTEACGSPAKDSCMVITYADDIQPMISPDVTGTCVPVEVNFSNVTNSTEVDYMTWSYDDGSEMDTTQGLSGVFHAFESPDLYDITVEVTSTHGCKYVSTFNNLIEGYAYPRAEFYINPTPASIFEPEVQCFSQSTSDVISHTWFAPGATPEFSNIKNPEFVYPGVIQNYPIQLIVENENGCRDTVEHIAIIANEVILYSPNAFTPDGDEFNQNWNVVIQGIDIYSFHLELFNRWGEVVFESYDSEIGWDGTYNGVIAPSGTYVWKISCKDQENDQKYEFDGHVTIIR